MSPKLVALGEIAEFVNGYAFKPTDWSNTGFKIIRIQNLTSGEKSFNRTSKSVPDKYLVKKGDILVSWSATLDVFEWSEEEDALLNQHIFLVKPFHDRISKKYFKYALGYSIAEMSNFTHGSTMKHIVRKDFLKHKIPLPTIEEQHRIVKILDLAQSLIEKRKQAIAYLDDYIKAVFLDMFGDPVSNSKGWERVKFTDVLVLSRGFDLPRQDRVAGSYPLVASNGIVDRISEFKINAPGIVTGRSGTLGSVQFIEEDYWPLNTTLYSQKLNGNNPVYLKFFLEFFDLKRFTRGAGVPTLNRNLFHSELIQKVPLDLQNKFEAIYRTNISLKQKMQSQRKELEDNFQVQLQRAFRGE